MPTNRNLCNERLFSVRPEPVEGCTVREGATVTVAKKIVIISTLDTKGEETRFVKKLIEGRGHLPFVIDCGIKGEPSFQPFISRQAVAEAANTTLDEIIAKTDKNYAIRTMTIGTTEIALRLYREGQLDGIIALGGVQGTMIGTTVMQALPVWCSKGDGFDCCQRPDRLRPVHRHQGHYHYPLRGRHLGIELRNPSGAGRGRRGDYGNG